MYTFIQWTIEMHKQWYAVYIIYTLLHFVEILGDFVLCFQSLYHKWEKIFSASFIFLNKARGWGKEKNSVWL